MPIDFATLGIKIDSSGIVSGAATGVQEFDRLTAAAARTSAQVTSTERSNIGLSNATKELGEQTAKLGEHFEFGRQGGRRLESAITGIGLAASGVTGPVARVIEGLVMFGAASLPLLELTAAIGVVVAAYELLTTGSRKAAEEQKKLIDAQEKRLKNVGDPTGLTETLKADTNAIAEAQKNISFWTRTALHDSMAGLPIWFDERRLRSEILELRRLEHAEQIDQAAMEQKHSDLIFATLERQKSQRITALEQAPGLLGGVSSKRLDASGAARAFDPAGVMSQIQAEMKQQLEIAQAHGVALVDRNAAQETYNKLLAASLAIQHEQDALIKGETEAHERAIQDQNQFLAALHATNLEAEKLLFSLPGNEHIKSLITLQKAQSLPEKTAREAKTFTDQVMGGFDKTEPFTRKIERPEIFDKMDKDAKLMEETWKHAVKGIQDAFATMFEDIGQKGFKLVSVLEDIAKAVQKSLAQLAAQSLVNAIFGSQGSGGGGGILGGILGAVFGSGGGGGAAGSVGNMTQSGGGDGRLSISPSVARGGTTVHVHQNVSFNAGFVDGASGEAWLQSRAGTIAGIVAKAASDAPAFARHIVGNGLR